MSLVEWGLSKLRPELAVPALFRAVTSLIGVATMFCVVTPSGRPSSATPMGFFAAVANHIDMPAAERWLISARQGLVQQPQYHQPLGLVAIAFVFAGFYLAARYRVGPIENLFVSATWVGLAALCELGCTAALLMLTAVSSAIVAAVQNVRRFGARYHRLRDRFLYIFFHVFGSLGDAAWLVSSLFIKGFGALDWQWVIVNPRAEFWRRIDYESNNHKAESQPHKQTFVMFGPRAIADEVRVNPQLTHADVWRLLKRSPDVEWGLGSRH